MSKFLQEQTAVVTGGMRGIGRAVTRKLQDAGAKVVVWDRQSGEWEEAGRAPDLIQNVDVSSLDSVQEAFAKVLAKFASVQILVNNAGINGPVAPSWEYPLDKFHEVLAIDLLGTYYCCRTVLPHLLGAHYGRIVNIASMAGKDGIPNISAYSVAKAGVIALTKSIAKEVAREGITVNAVAPAMAATELLKEMDPAHIDAMSAAIPRGKLIGVDEIADMVAFVASRKCSATTGFTFDVSGGKAVY